MNLLLSFNLGDDRYPRNWLNKTTHNNNSRIIYCTVDGDVTATLSFSGGTS